MRTLKLILIVLILGSITVPLISCRSESETEAVLENQVITVQRGDLTIDITAAGNLALAYTAEPAFEIAGYVEEVLVEEGDTVEEGQVLASLDTTSLQQTVKTAGQNLRTDEIDLEKATDSYRKITYPYSYRTLNFDVPAAVSLANDAQRELDEAMEVMQELGLSRGQYDWQQYWDVFINLKRAQDDLVEVKEKLIRGYGQDVFQSGILPMADFWTLRAAQLDMEKAQVSLDKAQDSLDIAKDEMEKAVVVARFAGCITQVNVEGGDEVFKGTVVAQLADPDRFEAEVMVSEMDIFQVKLEGDATVQVDAMPALILPAKVTSVAPTATIEAGVVNYTVKVAVESLKDFMQEQMEARQEAMESIQQGELLERIQQAIEEGQITQEQAEEMMKQMQQERGEQQEQLSMAIPENFQLREGLTVTVSIIVDERNDVLLVPNGAITTQGGRTYVQVLSLDGTIEGRAITTGISNWQYTEVTEGLSEGEQVVVLQGTTTTTTTPQQGPPGGMFIPGMGGPHR